MLKLCKLKTLTRLYSSSGGAAADFDVVVVGGGLVGSAVAAALSCNPWTQELRVAVLDRAEPPQLSSPLPAVPGLRVRSPGPEGLNSARKDACNLLTWTALSPSSPRAWPLTVWDWGGRGLINYHASDVGREEIGFVAENLILHIALLRQLARPGRPAVFQLPGTVKALKLPTYLPSIAEGHGMPLAQLTLDDGRQLTAKLVVGADGGRSRVRQLAGLRAVGWPYRQRGLVATVRTEPQNPAAHQRFLETGPIALLPVRDGFSNVVWSTTPRHAAALATLQPLDFAEAANEALNGGALPSESHWGGSFEPPPRIVERTGPQPQSFPLHLQHAGRYVRPRLALIGDAAHSVHPLAGQGVNLGFQDARVLAEALAHAVECGRDPGELRLLEDIYEKPRQRANVTMMGALDSLSRLYKPQQGLLASARSFGLGVLNSSGAAKGAIMKYAMGL